LKTYAHARLVDRSEIAHDELLGVGTAL